MPSPSLVEICKRVCIKNVANLLDVGGFEYFQIKDVLSEIKHPEQLHQIELRSPQIKGEDAELWRKFIAKAVPDWHKKNYAPKNSTKWYEVYCKYKREQLEEIKRDEDILRSQMMNLKKVQESKVSRVVDLKQLPKIPRDPRMLANNGGVPLAKRGFKKDGPSALNWTAGSKTKLTDGKSVLTRARREAKEISQMGKLSRPTHQLGGRIGQVSRAPAAMVKEYQTASQPAGRPVSSIKILTRKPKVDGTSKTGYGMSGPSLEEREKRLRALTMAGSKRDSLGNLKANLVGSSSDEDDDVDELFDEQSPSNSPSRSAHLPSSPPPPVIARTIAKPVTSLHHLSKSHSKSVVASMPQIVKKPPFRTFSTSPPARPVSASVRAPVQISSPAVGAPKSVAGTKRKPVDIFNRGPKKPRAS